ncbi:hypothetical protein FQN60_016597, partial [Etheostoma spectabile]
MALEQLSDVVQRCQALPEDSYTTEDHDVFTISVWTCIEEGNIAQVLSIVLDEKNQDIVRCMGWNLLPPLIQVLLKKEDKKRSQCLAIFNHVLQTCRPKELLIGLLEQLEQDDPDTIATSLHLLRKASSLGMTLSSVLDQVAKLPLPHTKEQEEDDVFSLCRCCTDLMDFVKPFVLEAKQNVLNTEAQNEILCSVFGVTWSTFASSCPELRSSGYRKDWYMLKTSNHSGVEGYVIKNIKNQIDVALQPGNSNAWFVGAHLLPLLRKVLSLPDGPETDLLHYLDRIMESLNLLRYLVIRDKVTDNQTGIWTELYKIEDMFLKPLRVGVNMSRAHYERELHDTMATNRAKAKEESVLSVSVGDEKLPNMTSESQIQALHSALHTFDMIESVLVRIEELTEWVLQGLSGCDPGGRVQVQQPIQQVVGLIRDSVPAPLIFLHLAVAVESLLASGSGVTSFGAALRPLSVSHSVLRSCRGSSRLHTTALPGSRSIQKQQLNLGVRCTLSQAKVHQRIPNTHF